jgi:16S rRNA (adenine1518-N6/adenine1519-N6)-dimethyltransferase
MIKRESVEKGRVHRGLQNMVNKYNNILKSMGLEPNKRLGQSFLIDEHVVDDQIAFANLTKADIVLEIGPGLGILTNKLAEHVRKVIGIEYDKKLYSYLKTEVPGNVEIIHGDALALDFPKFNKVVSNIPYQISSPLIFKLIDYQFTLAILMLQLEFARRLGAQPNTKEYSRLTIMTSYYYDVELLSNVSKTSFYPEPKIDSQLIKLSPKKARKTARDEHLFSNLIKIVFGERRKMMKNSILDHHFKFNIPKDDLKDIISGLPNMTCRPEELTLNHLIELADELYIALAKYN